MNLRFSTPILVSFCSVLILGQNSYSVKAQEETESNEILRYSPPKEIQEKLPYFLSGFDRDGSPVWILEFGRWDVRTLAEKGPEYPKLIETYTNQMFERLHVSPKSFGQSDFVAIVDFEGYDNRQFTSYLALQQIFHMARQFVRANPGGKGVKQVYLVNANYLFQTVYGLIKPILGSLANFIELYGTNPDKWMPVVLKQVPKNQIPEWLGGSVDHVPIKVYG